ncbi:MAG TPA: ATP-binding protein [Candidatus Acidoferrales bacterium]|nr:ATP-binding protein [Candidatus Acidoferrales bacterium]
MATVLRLLVVEDSEEDTLLLVGEIERGGYRVEYERVQSAAAMASALSRRTWDLVIADYTMPSFRGTDALEIFKRNGIDIPFIFVSGTIVESAAVEAMKAGAHDYVIKGNLKRLVPAIERELREAEVRRESKRAEQERARLFQETQRNLNRIRALREVETAIGSTLDLRTVLYLLLESGRRFLPFPHVSAARLWDKRTDSLRPEASRDVSMERWPLEDSESDRELMTKRAPLVIADLQRDWRTRRSAFFREHGLVSYLGVPLIASDEVLGVLEYYTKEEHRFTAEEVEFCSALAAQAAVAIQKAQLYEQTKRQANELQEKNAELERANGVKSAFLRLMSHEFRTPLTATMGYCGLLLDHYLGPITDGQSKAVKAILRQSTDLLVLIDNVLEATRLETERVRAQTHEVELAGLLEELKSGYTTPLDKDIALQWRLAADLPMMRTDADKVKAILRNLLSNALKFTEKGSVVVSARHLAESGSVELRVSDTGIGIPDELKARMFDLFRQADSSDTRTHEGVGLGLYIVKKYTELLGGRLAVESEVGRGSSFTVILPLRS